MTSEKFLVINPSIFNTLNTNKEISERIVLLLHLRYQVLKHKNRIIVPEVLLKLAPQPVQPSAPPAKSESLVVGGAALLFNAGESKGEESEANGGDYDVDGTPLKTDWSAKA